MSHLLLTGIYVYNAFEFYMKNITNSTKIEQFHQEFTSLLNPATSHGLSVHVFISNKLRQYNLKGRHNTIDVLLECYKRGLEAIEKGRSIYNLKAWVKRTSFNYIRELKRQYQRYIPFEEYMILHQPNEESISEEETEQEYYLIQEAFKRLSEIDQTLIQWKEIENLSWFDIHERWLIEKGQNLTVDALKQRKSRAIRRLRQEYHNLKGDR